MEDIICLSSGSDDDDDSDLEVISSYNDDKEDAVPFIRGQLLPVTPVSLFNYFLCSCLYHIRVCLFFFQPFARLSVSMQNMRTFTWCPHAKMHICFRVMRKLTLVSNRTWFLLFIHDARTLAAGDAGTRTGEVISSYL